jgi:HAD superfamily hydrolase (TIGR01509 family)
MDGVLIESFEAWAATVSEVSVRFGHGAVSRERVLAIWGQGIAADARTLYPGRTVEEIRRAYDEEWPRHVTEVALNPRGLEVLDLLGSLGIGRGVVTNTQASLAEAILAAKGIRRAVDVVSALVPGRREKPAPDLLLHALGALGASPAEALMVGDTRYDEEAARAAGLEFLHYDLGKGHDLVEALSARVDGVGSPA